jgi:uncharacterized membrane protein
LIRAIIWLTAITLIPALELRASIPFGIFGLPNSLFGFELARIGAPVGAFGADGTVTWPVVVVICVVANIILGWLVFMVLGPVFTFVRKWRWFDRTCWPILERTRHKIHPYVEKYGELGVAVFIGIPLPGSGVYTGAFGAYLLGLERRKFAVANVIGVLIAAVAVTGLCLLILNGLVGQDSWMARLFMKSMEPH